MEKSVRFPQSFPTTAECAFLELLFCTDEVFPEKLEAWAKRIVFDDLDYAIARLLPLVYMRLRALGIEHPLKGRMQGFYKLAWVKNQRLLAAVREVTQFLEQQDISVLFVKGIPLVLDAYRDMGARFMGDADLLIHPRHAKRAVTLLREHGWKPVNSYTPLPQYFSNESFPRLVKEATFVNSRGVELDLHWRLFEIEDDGKDALSFDALWAHSALVTHPTITYRIVAPDDLLLHVLVHGAAANPHRTLRWVPDAAVLIKEYAIDWDRFVETAAQGDWNVDVSTAFLFFKQHGFVKVPGAIEKKLTTLPYTLAERKRYERRASISYAPFGRLPSLWRTYWLSDAQESGYARVRGFFPYLAHAWGFERVRDLIPFILHKYQLRLKLIGPKGNSS